MKVKTSELIGPALDWAVAKCEGAMFQYDYEAGQLWLNYEADELFSPSTNWSQGGPIIEREKISLSAWGLVNWKALILKYTNEVEDEYICFGNTSLIAAMRGYVAYKLGDEIDIPEELL